MHTVDIVLSILFVLCTVIAVVYFSVVLWEASSNRQDFGTQVSRQIVNSMHISGRTQLLTVLWSVLWTAVFYYVNLPITATLNFIGTIVYLVMVNACMYVKATRLRQFA